MPKQLIFEDDARAAMLRGMDQVAEAVGSTLGPHGRTVVIGRPFGPATITKDGVTVASSISLPDPWENEGAKLLLEVAQRTATEAGDGTTAATILGRAIFKEGVRQIAAGAAGQALERGIRKATAVAIAFLKKYAVKVSTDDQILHIATIAANGDTELGSVIAQAFIKIGLEGVIRVDRSSSLLTCVEFAKGFEFARGFIAPQAFMTGRGETAFNNCNVFVTDRRLIDPKQMTVFLQNYQQRAGSVPLLIVAEDVEGPALQLLAVNNNRSVQVVPVKTPGSGPSKKDEINDIAIFTGAKFYSVALGKLPEQAPIEDFGSAQSVVVQPHRTTIIGGAGSSAVLEAHKEELRALIAEPLTKEYDRLQLEARLARLSVGIAVIQIGSATDAKLKERRDRVEDSIYATRGAIQEGFMPGGGTALLHCAPELISLIETLHGDEATGACIVLKVLSAPLWKLADNAGQPGDVVVNEVIRNLDKPGWGYNGLTGAYEDLVSAGIIDPVKVVRNALQNSAELAGLMLTTAALVVDLPENPNPAPSAPTPTFRG